VSFDDVTKEYVDLLSYNKYATRTADTVEFEALKSMYSQYLNPDPCAVPPKKYVHGLALLVCHHYAMDDTQAPDAGAPDTGVGPITSEKVGELTQVRGMQPYIGPITGWKYWLMQSKYGSEFLYLMKTFKSSPTVL
jgi:hypothetical protein